MTALISGPRLCTLQVNYCQGMAFVAGIILMYLPEEPAFRMLARLLDARGPNLRRLYLPGLEVCYAALLQTRRRLGPDCTFTCVSCRSTPWRQCCTPASGS